MSDHTVVEPPPDRLDRAPRPTARPPGAVAEPLFRALCDGCDECMDVCPESLIVIDEAGYPVLDESRGHCGGCGLCSDVCTRGAIADLNAKAQGAVALHTVDREALRPLVEQVAATILRRRTP